MKKFNINDSIFIEITDLGWKHLQSTVGDAYIENCIMPNRYIISGAVYYKLQCHEVFSLMPVSFGRTLMFKPHVILEGSSYGEQFEDKDYKKLYHELYGNVANMLVRNRDKNWSADVLLSKFDGFRK